MQPRPSLHRSVRTSGSARIAEVQQHLVVSQRRVQAPWAAPASSGRCLLTVATATPRRPVNRDLLDNVDSASPYGLDGGTFLGAGPNGDALDGRPYTEAFASQPSTSGAPQDTPAWGAFDREAWPPERPQWSPTNGPGGYGQSPSGYDNEEYGRSANGFSYGAAGHGNSNGRWDRAEAGATRSEPATGPAASPADAQPGAPTRQAWEPSQAPHPSQQQQQGQPSQSQPQQRHAQQRWPGPQLRAGGGGGGDWGEYDPLSDWGGAVASVSDDDAAGWDAGFGSASPSRGAGPSTRTRENPGSNSGSGAATSSGASGAADEPAWLPGEGGAAGPGPGASAGGYSGMDGWEAERARFTQDVGYDSGGAGGAGASSSGRGGTAPPPGVLQPSDIVLLSGRDASIILPLAPTSGQVEYFQPRSLQERIVQYLGSLGASVLLSKAAVLAGPALLYPIWSPWIRAGLRNLDLYSATFAAVGLWRAQVLDVQINGLAIGGMVLSRQPPTVSLLIGDPWVGGARASLDLPYQPRSELIQVGDSVELLVLCRDERFVSFKVVREVYLPQSGVWLCDYPFLNRDLFLAFSLAIERERRAATDAATAASYYAYDVQYDAAATGTAAAAAGATASPAAGEASAGAEQGDAPAGGWPRGQGQGRPGGPGGRPAGSAWPPPAGW